MKKYLIIACTFVLVLMSIQAFAMDGQRKGFILGGGVGAGFLSNKFSINSQSSTSSLRAILTEFKIGYATCNQWEIYFISKGHFWRDTFFEGTFFEGKGMATLILNAVGVSKYLNDSGTGLLLPVA